MKKLLTILAFLVIGIYGCEKESDLTAIGDQAAFKEVHKIVNCKHFKNDNGATVDITDEKVKFKTPQGYKYEIEIDSVRGFNASHVSATYYGDDYAAGVTLYELQGQQFVFSAYEGSHQIMAQTFDY